MDESKKLVKIGEAAKILGVSIDTLRRWEKSGKLSPVRTPGGTRLYSVSRLKQLNPQLPSLEESLDLPEINPLRYRVELSENSENQYIRESDDQTIRHSDISDSSGLSDAPSPSGSFRNLPSFVKPLATTLIVLTVTTTAAIAGFRFLPPQAQNTISQSIKPIQSLSSVLPFNSPSSNFNPLPPSSIVNLPSSNLSAVLAAANPSNTFIELNTDTTINGTLKVRDASVSGQLFAPNVINDIFAGSNVSIIPTATSSGNLRTISVNIPPQISVNGIVGPATLNAGTGISIASSSATLTISNSLSDTLSDVRTRGGCSGCITSGDLGSNSFLSGTVGIANGGTNITTYTTGDILYASATNILAKLPIGSSGQSLIVSSGLPAWGTVTAVNSINSANGSITITGAGINSVSTSGSTITITGTEADTLSSVTGRGASTSTASTFSGGLTSSGALTESANGAASTPAETLSGTWFSGGTATTTKPLVLIEPSSTTSTGWSTSGTGFGLNGASSFTGNLIDTQIAGSSVFKVNYQGNITTSGNITSASGSGTTLTLTPTSDTTALTLVGTNVTTQNLAYFNAHNSTGTIFNIAYGATQTLTGALIGQSIDLNNGQITNSNNDVTGFKVTLPTVTDSNATGTVNVKGFSFGFGTGTGINQTGAGATVYSGVDVSLPALTQTAGTLTGNGVNITTSSSITTGGTANGINISATGVGAGSLNGVKISNITAGAGTETALNVGSGWDSTLSVNGTTIINGSGVTQVAGGGTGIASYTTGDLLYASSSTLLAQLGIGSSGQVLKVSAGLPSWGTITGSVCTDCLISDPSSSATNTIAPTGATTTGLTVKQTSTASPTADIFDVTNSGGSTKFFSVDSSGNVSTGAISNTTLTLTPTSDTTALTLVGTNVATSKLSYFNSANTSGTVFDISYGAAKTLTANNSLTGQTINLSNNVTANGSAGANPISVTGLNVTLPSQTNANTSLTNALKGLVVTAGSGLNQTGAGGTTTFSGADITIPPLTQTAGTLTGNGVLITTPSSITTGGSANGLNISASGVGAGTLNGINISGITAGAGTETGLNIGGGWDTSLNIANNTTNTAATITNISLGTLTGGASSTVLNQITTGTLTASATSSNDWQANLGAVVGATTSTFGSVQTGALSGAGTTSYGINLGANASTATTNYGINVGAISGAGTTNYALNIGNLSAATGTVAGINLGTLTGGTGSSVYGINSGTLTSVASGTNFQANLGAVAGAASATFGGIQIGAISGAGTESDGLKIAANSATATNNYGVNIANMTSTGTSYGIKVGTLTGAGTTNYGLYVNTPSGATNNYGAIFAGGDVGIGTTAPSTQLHVVTTDSTSNAITNLLTLNHALSGVGWTSAQANTDSVQSSISSYYRFDESSGTTVGDTAGSNPGTATGTTILTTGCEINDCRSFNGSTDIVKTAAGHDPVNGSSSFSISVWIYPTSLNSGGDGNYVVDDRNNCVGFSFGATGGNAGGLGGNSNAALVVNCNGANNGVFESPTNSISLNTWNHVVLVFTSGSTPTIYINGVSKTVTTLANYTTFNWPSAASDFIAIGGSATAYSNAPFAGRIDEVGLWTRALTQTDVTDLYNSGSGTQYQGGGASANIGTGLAYKDTNSAGATISSAQIASLLSTATSGSETSALVFKTINAGGALTEVGRFANSGTDLTLAASSVATSVGLSIGALSGTTADTGISIGAISGTGATGAGLTIGNISTTGATNYGIQLGTLTGGTTSNYQISTGVLTSATTTTNAQLNLGGLVTTGGTTNYGINVGALSGSGTTNYGINVTASTATGTTNYGINIGALSGAGTTNYGLYIAGASGATTNYAEYINATQTGGTVSNISFPTTTLASALVGRKLDLNTNVTTANGLNVTGDSLLLPALTQTSAGTSTYIGYNLGTAGALVQNTLAGTINWTGLNIQMPNLTQTTGTVTSTGIAITGGTVTSGTSYALTTTASAGNVGIGTAAPSVYGDGGIGRNVEIRSTGASSAPNLTFSIDQVSSGANVGSLTWATTGTAGGEKRAAYIQASLDADSTSSTNGNLLFDTSNAGTLAEAMRINKAGNVGIGTAAPTSLLHLVGSQPASVATTPGSAATTVLTITGGTGGNTTIATTGVGGIGAPLSFTGGTGGQATAATTSATGGAGGLFTLRGGTGGASAVSGTGTNTGGAGGALTFSGGTGGAASTGTGTLTGGVGGLMELLGGNAGAGGNANGGNIYLTGGTATGTGTSGNVLLGITSGGTARGNVGIATAAPTNTLEVTGTLKATSTVTFSNLVSCDTIKTSSGGVLSCGNTVAKFQRFTSSGTFTQPSGAVLTIAETIGAGGGGGGGRGDASGTNRGGGGGGGGGARLSRTFAATTIGATGATVSVTVGTAGTAGSGGSSANGTAGGAGGNSSFGSFLTAYGGGGGAAGTATLGGGGGGGGGGAISAGATGATSTGGTGGDPAGAAGGNPGGNNNSLGGAGGGSSSADGGNAVYGGGGGGTDVSHSGGSSIYGCPGGGGGGYLNTANVVAGGGTGGNVNSYTAGGGSSGGAAQGGGGAGNPGTGGSAGGASNSEFCGTGGGGGGGTAANPGGAGGPGGAPGGAGGGGGGGTSTGGNGGAGGVGEVRVWTLSSGSGADLAETYFSNDLSVEDGDLVAADPDFPKIGFKKSSKPYDPTLIGIMSTKPGITLSDDSQLPLDSSGKPIKPMALALAGRVPLKVSTENGPILVGDYLTSSSIPGVAMKATRPGPTVGKALESFDGSNGSTGKIMTFLNVSYADPGQALSNLVLDDSGYLAVPKTKATSLLLSGVDQALLYSVIPAQAGIQTPNQVGGDNPLNTDITMVGTPASNNQPPVYVNLADTINTLLTHEATTSAQVAGISTQVASQSASISSIVNRQSDLEASSSGLLSAINDIRQTINDKLNLTPPSILEATGSAQLSDLKVANTISTLDLGTTDATVSGTFKALGNSFLGNTTIAGDLSIDGTFSVSSTSSGNSINALPNLYFQNSALSELVDFFNGLVTIDKEGLLTVQKLAVSDKTLGQATIPAGQVSVVVSTNQLTNNSRVFTSGNQPVAIAVTNKSVVLGKFNLSIDHPLSSDLSIDWWIVDEKPNEITNK